MVAIPLVPARVLVVDDERFFREAIGDALAAAGIGCESAANGEEALRLAQGQGVGVVVLDLGLPGLGGIEVLRRLRAEHPLTRVLTLAGQAEQGEVLEALRLGACDYLAKPLHEEELVLSVRRAVEAHAALTSWARLRRRVERLESRMAEIAVCARDTEPGLRSRVVAPLAAECVSEVLDAGLSSILLFDPAQGLLRVAARSGGDRACAELDPVALGEGVAGEALARREAFAVEDVDKDPRFAGRPEASRYASRSFAVAPVEGLEHPVGVLCATERIGGAAFGDEDLMLLRMLAHQLGREVCDAICNEVDPERMFAAALGPVARALSASPVSLYLIDAERGELALEQQAGSGAADRPSLPRDRGLTGVVLQTGWLVATARPEADARFDAAVDTPEDGDARPLLCVPVRVRGKVLGLLRAFPDDAAAASAHTGEMLAAVFSAAARSALLYRSLVASIDEVAEARRSARGGR